MEQSPWFTRDRPDRLLKRQSGEKNLVMNIELESFIALRRGGEMAKVRRIEKYFTVNAHLGKHVESRALACKKKPKNLKKAFPFFIKCLAVFCSCGVRHAELISSGPRAECFVILSTNSLKKFFYFFRACQHIHHHPLSVGGFRLSQVC
jgi:hypothetical protein